ncbi:MAG: aspartyl protease family protein [Candidatus Eisenbacteria bacterium]
MPRFDGRRPAWWLVAVLLAWTAASRAEATATPDAAAVIRRYVEASGGAEAFASERTLYTRARLSGFGFDGLMEVWSVRPDRRYARTKLGPFELSEGVNGARAWRTDPTTGRIVTLADQDLLESRVSTWFELERWAEPGEGGGDVKVFAEDRDSTGACTVLDVIAPGAESLKPRRLWFSKATGLLVRMETARDQAWMSTRLSDWRMAGGRRRAYVSETGISSMPANRLRSAADSFAVNVNADGLPFDPPAPAVAGGAAQVRWLNAKDSLAIPVEYASRHVWLRASVNGLPPEDFLFDTGATVTVLDSTYAAKLGLKGEGFMQAEGAGAAGSASFATLDSLVVHGPGGKGVALTHVKVALMSVSPTFRPYFWRDMAGVLGYDFISRFVVALDYDRGVLTLNDPATFAYAGAGQALPMIMNGVVPGVTGTLDDQYEGVFRLDVGSSSTVDVHAPFANRHGLEGRLTGSRDVEGAGFGGTFTTRIGRLSRMSLGPFTWDAPMVSVSRATEGAFASEEFAGNVGNRVLERFKVTFDYDHRRVWLEPGARYHDRDGFSRSGLLVGRVDGRMSALSVLSGSPAAQAGLRDGDTIVRVNGKPAERWTLAALDALLESSREGSRVKVEVLRDGRRSKHAIELREMLP